MSAPGSFVHRHPVRVRFGECDPMDVAYHPNYLVWFHEARDALLRGIGVDPAVVARSGFSVPIVEASCRYLQSARYPDELLVVVRTEATRVARLAFDFELFHAASGRLLATGRTVCVVLDATGRLLLRLPEAMTPLASAPASLPDPLEQEATT